MPTPASHVLRFGVFELDLHSGELRRHGLKIRLPDQAFQVLKTLVSRPGEVVTRDQLRRVLWTSDTFVDFEAGVNSAVRKLREALDDSAENPRFVETLPRRGYRFVASITADRVHPGSMTEPAAQVAAAVAGPLTDPALAPVGEQAAARPRSRAAVWAVGAALLVTLVVGAGFVYQPGGLEALRPEPAAEPLRSVVVLPFENLTGDAGQQAFVDSVTDAVTAHLAEVAGLDVISRTSARHYKQSGKRLPEIAAELQVDGVVEGSVAGSVGGVRITAKLIRASTGRHVWGHVYDEQVTQMLALQQRIASDVALAAGRHAPAPERTPRAITLQAHHAYVKGLTAAGLQRHEGYRRAVAYFEEAIAMQPDFAEAYAQLAFAQMQFLFGGPFSPRETIPKAEAAARKALELDPTQATAHLALGQILALYHWRWEDSAQALTRAAELQRGRQEFSMAIGGALIRRRQFAEAIAAAERGRRLDPLSVNAQVAVGTAFRAAGQPGRAVTELRRALEMSPGNNRVQFQLGITFVAMGRLGDAIRELEAAARPSHGHNSRLEAYLGYAYGAAGRAHDARKVLHELESHRREQYVSWFGIALIHDVLGEKEAALAALQRAFEDRAVEFAQMNQYPPFNAIASEPRFLAVMHQVGLLN